MAAVIAPKERLDPGAPNAAPADAILVVDLAFVSTYLTRAAYGFFQLDALSRRQVKWVVYGTFLALLPINTVEVLTFFKPTLWPTSILVNIFYIVVPISVFIAVTRFNLFDIDRLISATAAYTVVSVIVITGAIVILPTASQAATSASTEAHRSKGILR